MTVQALHHYTLRCDADQLEALRAFYETVLGLEAGARPQLRFGGYWLYAGGQPIVHLYASGARDAAAGPTALDHIAFKAEGLDATRERLRAQDIEFQEAPVPGWPLHQLFVHDPTGLRIELTFSL